MYLVGYFNLNVLEYKINRKIQNFFALIFQHGLIPIINKPTRVTKRNATAIDHIITNSYLSSKLKTGIIKTDISDHFPILLVSETPDISNYPSTTTIFKRYINDKSIKQFNLLLNEVNWNNVPQTKLMMYYRGMARPIRTQQPLATANGSRALFCPWAWPFFRGRMVAKSFRRLLIWHCEWLPCRYFMPSGP